MKELLLINEVKEYIVSEREKRKAAMENNSEKNLITEDEIKEDAHGDSLVTDDNTIAQYT